ncbi:MAG TPA: PIN domain-containing protein [Verrucomicrobiaceae bacterium]
MLVDTSFLVALLSGDDQHHVWAVSQVRAHPHPWHACDAVLSEAYHLLQRRKGESRLLELIERGVVHSGFHFDAEMTFILPLLRKYADVPMSFADGCLVRMAEIMPEPILLTADEDFRVYRRFGRNVIPCRLP